MTTGRRADSLIRRGVWLEGLTLAWNVLGVAVVCVGAVRARSVALSGFGLDSLIEIMASLVVLWQLTGRQAGRERPALALIGRAFVALAVYIPLQLLVTLWSGVRPGVSWTGTAWLAATVLVMLLLAHGKRQVGQQLGNAVLCTEARVTLVDALLALSVLAGTLVNAVWGWRWGDGASGLIIAAYALREGLLALRHSRDMP